MPITAADLAGTSAASRAAARAALVAYLQDLFPTLSVRSGPLADLALGIAGAALAAVEDRAAAVTASVDPETALAEGGYDPDLLTAILAGRGVTRRAAATATGSAGIKFSDDTRRTVQAGFRLKTADGVYYVASAATRLLPTTETATATGDVVLVAYPGGGYVGVVPVAAAATGAAGNRPAGTALTADSPLSGQTAAFLTEDADGGADAETDAALLARLPAAQAPLTVASADGAAGVVEAAAPAVTAVATLGFGQEGMSRGRSVLTGQGPGCLDVWVREAGLLRTYLTVTATLVDAGGVWQFSVGVDDAPGWLFLERVVQKDAFQATGYQPSTISLGYDLTGAAVLPNVTTPADAAMSRYMTGTFRFVDPDTSTSGLTVNVSTRQYTAVLRGLGGIEAAQAAVEDPDAAASGGDCLVRGACPVMVSVTALARAPTGVELTAPQVATAVAAAVNATGINNRLSAAEVVARASALLPVGSYLQLSGWSGIVHPTNAVPVTVTGSAGLEAGEDYAAAVGPLTTAFYADPEGVAATIET